MKITDSPRWFRVVLVALLPLAIAAAILWPRVREPLAAVLTLVVGAATAAYVLLTERLLEAQTRPNVILASEPHRTLLYLVVENVGAGEAFDVHFTIRSGGFDNFPAQLVTKARFMETGLTYLAPRQRVTSLLANLAGGLKEGPAAVEISVSYRSRQGKRYDNVVFAFNLRELEWMTLMEANTPLGRIAASIEKIEERLSRGV
jgi:hypothetical protein